MNDKVIVLRKISKDLNLNFEPQDWGIINAVPNKVREFIKYFEESSYSDSEKYELFELIIASFNEDLLIKKEDDKFFIDFIKKNSKNNTFSTIINYWKNLKDNEEYPIIETMRVISQTDDFGNESN